MLIGSFTIVCFLIMTMLVGVIKSYYLPILALRLQDYYNFTLL